jgi:hypothetical protein
MVQKLLAGWHTGRIKNKVSWKEQGPKMILVQREHGKTTLFFVFHLLIYLMSSCLEIHAAVSLIDT